MTRSVQQIIGTATGTTDPARLKRIEECVRRNIYRGASPDGRQADEIGNAARSAVLILDAADKKEREATADFEDVAGEFAERLGLAA